MNQLQDMDVIKWNMIKDKFTVMKLCNQLNIDFHSILGFSPQFQHYGDMVLDRFYVYEGLCSRSDTDFSVTFRFSLHYPEKLDMLLSNEIYSDLSYEKLCYIADSRRTINSVLIDSFEVETARWDTEMLLMLKFLNRVKGVKSVKKVFIKSLFSQSREFWYSIGFRDLEISDYESTAYPNDYSASLVYDLY